MQMPAQEKETIKILIHLLVLVSKLFFEYWKLLKAWFSLVVQAFCWLTTDVMAAMLGDKNKAFSSTGN